MSFLIGMLDMVCEGLHRLNGGASLFSRVMMGHEAPMVRTDWNDLVMVTCEGVRRLSIHVDTLALCGRESKITASGHCGHCRNEPRPWDLKRDEDSSIYVCRVVCIRGMKPVLA